jgi:hypothetical protein
MTGWVAIPKPRDKVYNIWLFDPTSPINAYRTHVERELKQTVYCLMLSFNKKKSKHYEELSFDGGDTTDI